MPSGLPEQQPTSPENPEDEERQRNYTPQNELGLPVSKIAAEKIIEEAAGDTAFPEKRPTHPENRQRNYTPQNELGLPVSKLTAEKIVEAAMEDATGSWEKPNLEPGEDVGRVSSRSVQLFGIGFAVLLVLVIWIAFTFKAPTEQGQGEVDVVRGIHEIETELQKKVTEFLAAESWEDVTHLVRGGDWLQDKLSLYQQRSPKESVTIEKYRPLDVIMVRGDQFLYMLGYKDENGTAASIYFTPDEPNHIIWEAFVAYCDGPFDELDSSDEGSKDAGAYRVYAQAYHDYEGNYDEESWQSIRLSYRSSDKQISAYVKRDSPQAKKLKPLLNKREGRVPLVLSIYPSDSSVPRSSPEIIDLLGVGWHEIGNSEPQKDQ
ncbi:MAG: hypothetical protein P8I97_12135 [Verrucomicrobiales bacterium]|nr:hypothetical protein [Verrucomicrobiales bacterium]